MCIVIVFLYSVEFDYVFDYGWWIGGGLVVSLLVFVLLMYLVGLLIDLFDCDNVFFYICGVIVVVLWFGICDCGFCYVCVLGDGVEYYVIFIMFVLMGVVVSYLVVVMIEGFYDVVF